ncbi:MAG TPA: hypothetical protein EYQ50_03195 [Verrucomicrobiales bacterium]|nr:hypothetical protein [Verrucomicrobiales bacterium]
MENQLASTLKVFSYWPPISGFFEPAEVINVGTDDERLRYVSRVNIRSISHAFARVEVIH